MKRTMIVLAAIYLFVVAFSYSTSAQGTNNVIAFTDSREFDKSLQGLIMLDDSVISSSLKDLSAINGKAIKDFSKRFGNALSEQWYQIPDGFVSYFNVNGFANRALYDKKGRWQYTVKFYDEFQLPHDIRAAIKSIYYDYKITVVEEIDASQNLIYIVHMEDKTSIKNLRVSNDGEIEVMEEFTKG
jgi:hypothetical protein